MVLIFIQQNSQVMAQTKRKNSQKQHSDRQAYNAQSEYSFRHIIADAISIPLNFLVTTIDVTIDKPTSRVNCFKLPFRCLIEVKVAEKKFYLID